MALNVKMHFYGFLAICAATQVYIIHNYLYAI